MFDTAVLFSQTVTDAATIKQIATDAARLAIADPHIEQVKYLYEKSWDHFTWLVYIVGGLVIFFGGFVPTYYTAIRRKEFKLQEDELRKLKEDLGLVSGEIKKSEQQSLVEIEKKTKILEREMSRQATKQQAELMVLSAQTFIDFYDVQPNRDMLSRAVAFQLIGVSDFLDAGEVERAKELIDIILQNPIYAAEKDSAKVRTYVEGASNKAESLERFFIRIGNKIGDVGLSSKLEYFVLGSSVVR